MMYILEEAEAILEREQSYSYYRDPRYQRLNERHVVAVHGGHWKDAHDLLTLIGLIRERFSHGEWVLNGEWN